MKFKVGDKVRIKAEYIAKTEVEAFTHGMYAPSFKDRILTIRAYHDRADMLGWINMYEFCNAKEEYIELVSKLSEVLS